MNHTITTELLTALIPAADREGRHVLAVFCGDNGENFPPVMVDEVPAMDRNMCTVFMDAMARVGVKAGATTVHLTVCRPGAPDLTPEDHLWIEAMNRSDAAITFATLHLATPGQIVPLV